MTDDATQGMLFGSLTSESEDTGLVTDGELRLCALNVNSPSPSRAQALGDWLLAAKPGALVLTEMQPSQGCQLILSSLEAEGYEVTCGPGWRSSRYFAAIAVRGFATSPVHPQAFDPRITAVDLEVVGAVVRLVGVYGPTNGMTAESSQGRQEFQHRLLDYLASIAHPAMCLTGDLNIVDPGHQPKLPAFEPHDYAFYTSLIDLGLTDAFKATNPGNSEHSWISDRYGAQRLDHTLVSAAAGKITACRYDHGPRVDQLTDHAAMLTTIDLAGH